MKTEVLPLLVGLSLCGASAVLLYIWYKTKDESTDTIDSAKTKTPKKNQKTKLECVIPNAIVPLVVGRSGANVKSIEAKTGATITFREKDDQSQVCEITGTSESVQKAADLIQHEASPPPIITEELNVPQTACGKIIGRCGEALQEICRKSMAKVYIDSSDRTEGNTRRVRITGTQAHVNVAKSLIEEKVREDVELRKTLEETQLKREPRGNSKHSNGGELSAASSLSSINSNEVVPPKGMKLPSSIGGQMEVYVSAIASPSRFWVQLVGPQSKQLDTLVETMTNYYNDEENRKLHKIADPYLGQIVAAMFKYDGKWYRAEIVGILPNEFNPRNVVLDVCFVDFGDSEYVAPHEVFQLQQEYLTLRFQAVECFLANIKVAHCDEPDVWHSDGISRFEELTHVAKWQKIHARIVTTKERKYGDPVRREGSPVPGVELYDTIDGHEINIGQELIREGHAVEDILSAAPVKTDQVLRLDGGTAPPASDNTSIASVPVTNINKLTEIINKEKSINNGGNSGHNGSNFTTNGRKSTNDGWPTPSPSNNGTNHSTNSEKDKFTAICENTTNENYENIKIDTRNQSAVNNTFLAAEKQNGNNTNSNTIRTVHTDKNENDINVTVLKTT